MQVIGFLGEDWYVFRILYFNQTRDEIQLEFLYLLACILVKIKPSTALFGVPTSAHTVLRIPQFGVILCYTFLFIIHINTNTATFTFFILL